MHKANPIARLTRLPRVLLAVLILLTPTSLMYVAYTIVRPTRLSAPSCISVVGDSVAYGDVVYEFIGVGYVIAHLKPVSKSIEEYYQQHGLNVSVHDRSKAKAGISSDNHPSYFASPEYTALMADRCPYTVILPWINDLTTPVTLELAAKLHGMALSRLANDILAQNPNATILILGYYHGIPAPFAAVGFASGFTSAAVTAFNSQIATCNMGANVHCLDINHALVGVPYLAGNVSERELRDTLAIPLSEQEDKMVTAFFGMNGSALATGDGVHLSEAGKLAVAAYVAQFMR
jgi:hypothetical protein